MKVKLLFEKTAILDLTESVKWYEQQKKGLGIEFYNAVKSETKKIEVKSINCSNEIFRDTYIDH